MADPKKKPERQRFDKSALEELTGGLQVVINDLLENRTESENLARAINLMVLGAQSMANPVGGNDE